MQIGISICPDMGIKDYCGKQFHFWAKKILRNYSGVFCKWEKSAKSLISLRVKYYGILPSRAAVTNSATEVNKRPTEVSAAP